jgi:hypothetical protein
MASLAGVDLDRGPSCAAIVAVSSRFAVKYICRQCSTIARVRSRDRGTAIFGQSLARRQGSRILTYVFSALQTVTVCYSGSCVLVLG